LRIDAPASNAKPENSQCSEVQAYPSGKTGGLGVTTDGDGVLYIFTFNFYFFSKPGVLALENLQSGHPKFGLLLAKQGHSEHEAFLIVISVTTKKKKKNLSRIKF
jgi:hypothetical protein